MSDIHETPSVAHPWCPKCEPDLDPMTQILDVRWCESHRPLEHGAADRLVQTDVYLLGSQEAGGDDNRRWCAIFHGKKK